MRALLDVILIALNFYTWIIIAHIIFSWLYAFNVINTGNQFIATIGNMLYQMTEPVLRPIRNRLPMLGGLDLSPLVLILFVFFLQRVIVYYIYPSVY
ncbi:YggT family protein [Coralliovum pocilloporae]|uniref:YggT family protein n=1 Tax=Coralliovum pocilloporae TaxID=3066369 RepID=UPI0033075E44